ncbi:hypothetical protein [Psychromonas ossibalaenae]|uniref:hypothetical protein n=1 Tax=Psychromonas ossibalaenae TaxID=444922 RepID=UPI0003689CA0|nr:hypothetical protein [Psychromonas ossibalaenae]
MKQLTILCVISFSTSALATGGTPSAPCYIDGAMAGSNTVVTTCGKTVNTETITLKERLATVNNSYDWLSQGNVDGKATITLNEHPLTAAHTYDWIM